MINNLFLKFLIFKYNSKQKFTSHSISFNFLNFFYKPFYFDLFLSIRNYNFINFLYIHILLNSYNEHKQKINNLFFIKNYQNYLLGSALNNNFTYQNEPELLIYKINSKLIFNFKEKDLFKYKYSKSYQYFQIFSNFPIFEKITATLLTKQTKKRNLNHIRVDINFVYIFLKKYKQNLKSHYIFNYNFDRGFNFNFFFKKFNFNKSYSVLSLKYIILKINPSNTDPYFINSLNKFYLNKNKLISTNFKYNFIFLRQSQVVYFINFFKIVDFKNNFFRNYNFNFNINNLIKYFVFINDFYKVFNNNFFSSRYLINYSLMFNANKLVFNNVKTYTSYHYFNNYYPIFLLEKKSIQRFLNKFKLNFNSDFFPYFNSIIINFFEFFFKSNFFLKISNNHFKPLPFKRIILTIFSDYKFYQPKYMKKFLMSDFFEILWYSLYLKDLKLISNWVTNLMESINFKFHKKFLMFFQNFMYKYSGVFIDILKIKGFLFDIRGKVGVTGSSKKRHICFKIGSIDKSSKKSKINFNQNLVRTYSGVLGLTYIINY